MDDAADPDPGTAAFLTDDALESDSGACLAAESAWATLAVAACAAGSVKEPHAAAARSAASKAGGGAEGGWGSDDRKRRVFGVAEPDSVMWGSSLRNGLRAEWSAVKCEGSTRGSKFADKLATSSAVTGDRGSGSG